MSRRIDVELTSRRDDGSWTWRAAGAREPRGVVEAELIPGEPKVGDVLKVEIETFIDGIGILSVSSPRITRAEPQRLELLGPSRPDRLVTTTLAPRGRGERDRPRRPRRRSGATAAAETVGGTASGGTGAPGTATMVPGGAAPPLGVAVIDGTRPSRSRG